MLQFITSFFQVGGDTFSQEEKDTISNKIKNTTEEEAIRDFEHLKRMVYKIFFRVKIKFLSQVLLQINSIYIYFILRMNL